MNQLLRHVLYARIDGAVRDKLGIHGLGNELTRLSGE
jgi:hypothetical protein